MRDQFHGQGKLIDLQKQHEYIGAFEEGKMHGAVVQTGLTTNELIYQGEYRNNLKHGRGVFRSGDRTYDGEFSQGELAGQGTLKYKNGDVYKGAFQKNIPNGHGTMKCNDGSEYTGDFKDGAYSGSGRIRLANGDTYQGQFTAGKRVGHGTYTEADTGISYEGEWADDHKHGPFTIRADTGKTTTGAYIRGEKHGNFDTLQSNGTSSRETWEHGRRILKDPK